MDRNQRQRRVIAAGAVAAVVVGSTLLVAGPASAAPGDASAVGVSVELDSSVLAIGIDADLGAGTAAVVGSGTDTDNLATVALNVPGVASVASGAVTSSATSTIAGSGAQSTIAGARVGVLGVVDVLALDATNGTASAVANCPIGGTPTATAAVEGLTVLGVPITIDDLPYTTSVALGGAEAGLDLDLTLNQVETVTAGTAIATALVATLSVDDVPNAVTATGSIVLASAACETPIATPVSVTALTPDEGPTVGGQTVTITGTGFAPGTTVTFGGVPATNVVASTDGTSLTALTPAGAEGVTVASVTSLGGTDTFPYTYVNSAITGFTPGGGPEAGGTTITITGTGLADTTGVAFGSTPAQVVSTSATEVVVVTPAGVGAAAISIALPGNVLIAAPVPFQYLGADDRAVAGLTPVQGSYLGGETVIISGVGLQDTEGVNFGGAAAIVTDVAFDGTTVTVVTPAGTPGFAPVTVVFSDASTTPAGSYLYVSPDSPVIGAISPAAGSTSGGTTVVITGDNLAGVDEVLFGGTAGTIVGTPTNDTLTVITPAGYAGAVDVILNTAADGSALLLDGYTYVVVTAMAPANLASTGVSTPVLPVAGGALALLLLGFGALVAVKKRRRLS